MAMWATVYPTCALAASKKMDLNAIQRTMMISNGPTVGLTPTYDRDCGQKIPNAEEVVTLTLPVLTRHRTDNRKGRSEADSLGDAGEKQAEKMLRTVRPGYILAMVIKNRMSTCSDVKLSRQG